MNTETQKQNSAAGIICLHCGKINLPPNKSSFDIWHCSYCFSGFISTVMLANLAPRELKEQIDEKLSSKKGRGCAMCKRTMRLSEVTFNHRDLSLEVCTHCRIIWFESGELMRNLRHRPAESQIIEETPAETTKTTPAAPAPEDDAATVRQRFQEYHQREAQARAKVIQPQSQARNEGFLPTRTLILIGLCAVLAPLTAHFPDVLMRFGMWPAHPLRLWGTTWLFSIFLHESSGQLMWSLPLLLLTGSFVEYRIGAKRFLVLFLFSGVMGRLIYFFSGAPLDAICAGVGYSVCGVAAYAILSFPYLTFLYPDPRWRSPAGALAVLVIGILAVCGFMLGWDFFGVAVDKLASGGDPNNISGTFLAQCIDWLKTASFHAYFTACAVGIVVCLSDAVNNRFPPSGGGSKAPRRDASRPWRRATLR